MYDFLLYGLLAPYDSPDQMQTLKNGQLQRRLPLHYVFLTHLVWHQYFHFHNHSQMLNKLFFHLHFQYKKHRILRVP